MPQYRTALFNMVQCYSAWIFETTIICTITKENLKFLIIVQPSACYVVSDQVMRNQVTKDHCEMINFPEVQYWAKGRLVVIAARLLLLFSKTGKYIN